MSAMAIPFDSWIVPVLGEVLWILFTPVPEMHLIGNCEDATIRKAHNWRE
jgi:hypothetical protein